MTENNSYEYDGYFLRHNDKVIPVPKDDQNKDMEVQISIGDSTYDPVSGTFKNALIARYAMIFLISILILLLILL